jgi:hypothetical protein
MAECFNGEGVEFPSEEFPLHMSTLSRAQSKDEALKKLVKDNPLYSQKRYKRATTPIRFGSLRRVVS